MLQAGRFLTRSIRSSSSVSATPTAALVPPGECIFGNEWRPMPLIKKVPISHDTCKYTFGLEDGKSLGLSTCACILARGGLGEDNEPLVRPYTPVSTNNTVGEFDLMVKCYGRGLSGYLDTMDIGATLEFKHIDFNVKTQYPFGIKRIGMVVGGTGITPMLQALHAILGTDGDTTQVSILYGSRSSKDILARDTLEAWSQSFPGRLKVTHVLSEEEDNSWTGDRGLIGRDLIAAHMPPPEDDDDGQIWVCGPPPMYDTLCGPRGEADLCGVLAEMGYASSQVYKF